MFVSGKEELWNANESRDSLPLSCINMKAWHEKGHRVRKSSRIRWTMHDHVCTHGVRDGQKVRLWPCRCSNWTPLKPSQRQRQMRQSTDRPVFLIISQWRPFKSISSVLWGFTSHFPSGSKLTCTWLMKSLERQQEVPTWMSSPWLTDCWKMCVHVLFSETYFSLRIKL